MPLSIYDLHGTFPVFYRSKEVPEASDLRWSCPAFQCLMFAPFNIKHISFKESYYKIKVCLNSKLGVA